MNDDQLERALISVGKNCFIKNYNFFIDEKLSNSDIVEILKKNTNYTEKSCISRTGHARRIIHSNRTKDALKLIIESNVNRIGFQTIELAKEYFSDL